MALARRGAVAVIVCGVLAPVGCAPPANVRYQERLEEAPAATEHAVHAARLAELMRGLDRLSGQRLPQAMDAGQERAWRVQEAREVALAIADAATRIPTLGTGSTRSESEIQAFRERARALEASARRFAERAPDLSTQAMEREARALREVCTSCHVRFRPGYVPGEDVP